jgi:hypothetical protein
MHITFRFFLHFCKKVDPHISYRDGPFPVESVMPTPTAHLLSSSSSNNNNETSSKSMKDKQSVQEAVANIEKDIAHKDGLLREMSKLPSGGVTSGGGGGIDHSTDHSTDHSLDIYGEKVTDHISSHENGSRQVDRPEDRVTGDHHHHTATTTISTPTTPVLGPVSSSISHKPEMKGKPEDRVEVVENLTLEKLTTFSPSIASHTTTSNIKNLKHQNMNHQPQDTTTTSSSSSSTTAPPSTFQLNPIEESKGSKKHLHLHHHNFNSSSLSTSLSSSSTSSTLLNKFNHPTSATNSTTNSVESSPRRGPMSTTTTNSLMNLAPHDDVLRRQILPLDSFGCVVGAQVSQAMYFVKVCV